MSTNNPAAIYQTFGVQPLTEPFADTQRRRLCFRNERTLYSRTCSGTGDTIVSIYAPDSPLTVYKADYWHSDAWDPLDYGQDVDFSRPFFEQFDEVHRQVPRVALFNVNASNSDYCNMTGGNKNCYLIFGGDFNEDCLYGTLGMHNRDSLDLDYADRNEVCYELTDSENCYSCQFALDSKNCRDCFFISDCSSCSDCILSTNLVSKQYYIENQPYPKEEYFRRKKDLLDGSRAGQAKLLDRFAALRAERTVKYAHITNSEDCTGDYIRSSKGCSHSFDVTDSENITDVIFSAGPAKDFVDCTLVGHKSELLFNTISTALSSYRVLCSFIVTESSDVSYSQHILSSKHIFGCAGLRNQEYCILNKKYSEREYHALRDRLVAHMKETGEWGQFFPPALSDFGYNESAAQSYFPLDRQTALAQGYRWKDDTNKVSTSATMTVPDTITEVTEDILAGILQCADCRKNYKIMPQELVFYRKATLPVPDRCSECRHQRRMAQRTPRRLWSRSCSNCSQELQSSYAPDRPERILCETCYQKEVY